MKLENKDSMPLGFELPCSFITLTASCVYSAGLSLTQVGGFDIDLQSTPRQFSGISLGMTVLFNLIGGSIGPNQM
jgi:hypothetical protein